MACSDHATLLDAWTSWAFFDGVNCFYADQLGQSVIAFIFFGVTAMTLYMGTGSIVIPVVIGFITGGIIFALMPALGIEVALIALVLVASGAMYVMARRAAQRN